MIIQCDGFLSTVHLNDITCSVIGCVMQQYRACVVDFHGLEIVYVYCIRMSPFRGIAIPVFHFVISFNCLLSFLSPVIIVDFM